MLHKAIVEEVIDKYNLRVRIPFYDKAAESASATKFEDLSIACICTSPGEEPAYLKGDIVFVEFEDNDIGKPVVMGPLFMEGGVKSKTNISANSLEVLVNSNIPDVVRNINGMTGDVIFEGGSGSGPLPDNLVYHDEEMTPTDIPPWVTSVNGQSGTVSFGYDHRNLLDNPFFTINQRGASSYNNGYTWDRWLISGSGDAISRSADMMTYTTNGNYQSLLQRLELNALEVGAVYTLSVLFSDNVIESITFTLKSGTFHVGRWQHENEKFGVATSNEYGNYWAIYPFNSGTYGGGTVSFKAVKLELGSISTLAYDAPPNYAEELAKCQRYFLRLGYKNIPVGIGMGQARLATLCTVLCPIPVTMRDGATITSNNVVVRNGNAGINTTSVTIDRQGTNNFYLNCITTGLTVGAVYDCYAPANQGIDFSADL